MEQKFNKDLPHLACRHHIHELILANAHSVIMHENANSNFESSTNFKIFCPHIAQEKFKSASDSTHSAAIIASFKFDVIIFALAQLKDHCPPADYKEFLSNLRSYS